MDIKMQPIGIFHCDHHEKYHLQRQGGVLDGYHGKVVLEPHQNFEQALEGVDGFDRIWLIYGFHKNNHWKPKVMPPRADRKHGVFATRSPHRPNAIGMSAVRLLRVKGRTLYVEDHDLLDGTLILDIKPYVDYCDSFISEPQGWLDELPQENEYYIIWDENVVEQIDFLEANGTFNIRLPVRNNLAVNPFPSKSNRIQELEDGTYQLAVKSWRIHFAVDAAALVVKIIDIYSGYDEDTLNGNKQSKWSDVNLHRQLIYFYKMRRNEEET